jgi:hypothetical protein
MKKLIATIVLSILLTPAAFAHHQYDRYYDDDYNHGHYYNYPQANTQFHPQDPDYYSGNKRLELKERADIERASESNWHFDQYSREYYRCNWIYNKNLGTWVCEKDYGKSQPVAVCPLGYKLSAQKTYCLKEGYTPPVKQAAAEPEPVFVERVIYVYEEEEPVVPPTLPPTGSGVFWLLFISVYGALFLYIQDRSRQLGKSLKKERIQAQQKVHISEKTN